jgi:putative membrane protein
MSANVFWAWLHYLAAFVLFSTLVVEHLLFRPQLDAATAKRIGSVDALYGISAVAVLITGFVRMAYEKGFAFYLQHWSFYALFIVFVIVGLLSIYPTVVYLRWRKDLREGRAPVIDVETARRVIIILRTELLLVLVMPLLAAWMARG